MKPEQARELVGERMLAATTGGYRSTATVEELAVLEVSPSGNWVKVRDLRGNRNWRATNEVTLVEALQAREPKPKWTGHDIIVIRTADEWCNAFGTEAPSWFSGAGSEVHLRGCAAKAKP